MPKERLKAYSFQIAQIPLRSVVADKEYFSISPSSDEADANRALFEACKHRLQTNFNALMKYKRSMGMPVLLLNFATPQVNPLGFLMPRYSLTNFAEFVHQLNVALNEMIENEGGVYLIDFDAITASLGKRYIIDDMSSHMNHGSFIGSTFWPPDESELTPYGSIPELYQPKNSEATLALLNECLAAYYTLSPTRKIKIVIFDLDGTLWRGVPAEADEVDSGRISEGWPLSLVEAAAFLKKRGVLIAIASKNDPQTALKIWNKTYGKRLSIDNFASVKISWRSKIESVGEILKEVNLLPENCLFVDDNPIEREQVAAAFPGISVITGPISTWKRTLLWSAELQTPVITKESVERTQSVQKMVARDVLKEQMTPEQYLQSLDVKIDIDVIASAQDRKFARAFELLNKTNQFNTTGKRWKSAELQELFEGGGRLHAASVSDRLSDYGLTAIALQRGPVCEQMVMSCRVFGLNVEHRLLAHIVARADPPGSTQIAFRPNEKNGPSARFLVSIGIPLDAEDASDVRLYSTPPDFAPSAPASPELRLDPG